MKALLGLALLALLSLPLATVAQGKKTTIKVGPKMEKELFTAGRDGDPPVPTVPGVATFGWWSKGWPIVWLPPAKVSSVPAWTDTVTVDNINGDIRVSAVARCSGVTKKGTVISGGCFCTEEDQVGASGPVYLNPTTDIFDFCGPTAGPTGGPLPCNAWLCSCEDDDVLQPPVDATAQAYCTI